MKQIDRKARERVRNSLFIVKFFLKGIPFIHGSLGIERTVRKVIV
jgi:hypothetical protein